MNVVLEKMIVISRQSVATGRAAINVCVSQDSKGMDSIVREKVSQTFYSIDFVSIIACNIGSLQ